MRTLTNYLMEAKIDDAHQNIINIYEELTQLLGKEHFSYGVSNSGKTSAFRISYILENDKLHSEILFRGEYSNKGLKITPPQLFIERLFGANIDNRENVFDPRYYYVGGNRNKTERFGFIQWFDWLSDWEPVGMKKKISTVLKIGVGGYGLAQRKELHNNFVIPYESCEVFFNKLKQDISLLEDMNKTILNNKDLYDEEYWLDHNNFKEPKVFIKNMGIVKFIDKFLS